MCKNKGEAWDNYVSKFNTLTGLMENAGIDTTLLEDLIEAYKELNT